MAIVPLVDMTNHVNRGCTATVESASESKGSTLVYSALFNAKWRVGCYRLVVACVKKISSVFVCG